jgi:hypothetical protein
MIYIAHVSTKPKRIVGSAALVFANHAPDNLER